MAVNQTGSFGYQTDLSGLFDSVIALVKEYMHQYQSRDGKVIEFRTPDEISRLVDLSLPEEPISEDQILEQCKSVLKYSVHTGMYHIHYIQCVCILFTETGSAVL